MGLRKYLWEQDGCFNYFIIKLKMQKLMKLNKQIRKQVLLLLTVYHFADCVILYRKINHKFDGIDF